MITEIVFLDHAPEELDKTKFTVEFGQENAQMASCLNPLPHQRPWFMKILFNAKYFIKNSSGLSK